MIEPRRLKLYNLKDLDLIPQMANLSAEERFATKVVAHVLPFRSNNYVIEDLINWNNVPDDPMFQLTFMQREMLTSNQFSRMATLLHEKAPPEKISQVANQIRYELNPHPNGQLAANVPVMDDEPIPGVQHKYKETCLVFPSSGQTCHAYCTFCFRWAQFVGLDDLKFATDESRRFQQYIASHKELTDILFTGGDPMVMTYKKLKTYIEPLLGPDFDHIQNIRIGTKSVSYWPYRFVTDKDADDVLRLFEKVVKSGKHLAIMGHYNHWVELSTDIAKEAVRRIRDTGAEIRSQSPLIRNINDSAKVWTRMWKEQVKIGVIPYYFFVERHTGSSQYFKVPLAEAFDIFRNAVTKVSGLSRTVRGPSMSAKPGKVVIEGVADIHGEKYFVLNFIQGRNPDWVKRPFFAEYNKAASWLDELQPAWGKSKFFYEDELKKLTAVPIGSSSHEMDGFAASVWN
ncbi:MAG: lysine 2,3-aminomutase [Ignavibacteriales bacterium]|nr:lysine 2,3-aminomutase [Ignavibacteriales bacterium]MCF8305113.1 lysine 2,3-aminomutase [Ignavibacteriales bacterium]MCF8314973.1 lysine 2,3-aminomutase [Ignavibacteriales bacterium]MCF8436077.1 lysine 2,3-aminomutase [Ignavibacteriales bacterium]